MPSLLWRWHEWLSEYDFDIEWVSAAQMKTADALSRRRYRDGDYGTMDKPFPRRDPLWGREDADENDARTRSDDDFWIDISDDEVDLVGQPADAEHHHHDHHHLDDLFGTGQGGPSVKQLQLFELYK